MLKFASCVLLMLCGSGRILAQAPATRPADEVYLRPMVLLSAPLSAHTALVVSGQLNYGSDFRTLRTKRVGTLVQFDVGPRLRLAPGYLFYHHHARSGAVTTEHRPSLAASLHPPPLHRLVVYHRSTLEHRIRPAGNSTRYRAGLFADHPVRVGGIALRLQASGELFYDWSSHGWVRNQLSAGVNTRLGPVSTTFYYQRQGNHPADAADVHIVGTTFNVQLKHGTSRP